MPGRGGDNDHYFSRLAGPLASLFVMMAMGVVWMTYATASVPQLSEPPSLSTTTSEPDRGYIDYVTPRLDALIEETDAVATLVEERSRNILALQRHANRIEALVDDLTQYSDQHTVPRRFESIHEDILSGGTEVETIIQNARGAMVRFDFTSLPTLLDRFERASELLVEAREQLDPVEFVYAGNLMH